MINYIALIVALAVSAVSAYYSIVGLATIFAAAFYPVVSMGIALELGKLVTASWLYRNWAFCARWLKYYLTLAVVILMFITSMGIFGFLSKAHIEQTLALNTGSVEQIKIINTKIEFEKETIKDFDKQIDQIDNAIKSLKAKDSLKANDEQRKNRQEIIDKKSKSLQTISALTQDKIKLESEFKKLEAEVGPIKYIADMIFEQTDNNQLEKAVRLVIITLIFVFDPLAVLLLIAANDGIARGMPKKVGRPLGSKNKKNKIEIDVNNIKRI